MVLLGLGTILTSNAQHDVSVSLNNYTNNQSTSDDPLDMVYTVTNEGAALIPSGDTLFFAFTIGLTNYSLALVNGGVSYIPLTADFPAGASLDLSTVSPAPSTMSMAWLYNEMGGLNGTVCAFAGVGQASLSFTAGSDADFSDNLMCVQYTVTEVAGLDGVGMDFINVYPNPAADIVNFSVGNNVVSHIDVYDMSGRLVNSIVVSATVETISTENMESGMYYYQMMNGEEMVATDKFVVSK